MLLISKMRKRFEVQGDESDPFQDFKNYEAKRRKNTIHSVSPILGFIFMTLLLGLYGLVYVIDNILPTPLKLADEKDNPNSFITERAQHDLKLLTDLGPRIVGSYENEALAVDFFKREITFVQQLAHPNQKIELDIQTASGSYFIDFKPHGAINVYGNVQNVIVKLHSKNNSTHSLLVNAHYDSVPTSPGGSDDGINCAVMLEILRKLSRSPDPPQHNIIFLFNGAEETGLHAAHGFIAQHKWAKEVGVLLNLEAAGAGGKEVLFQAGPGQPWLLNYYKKVPHPNGQATGEELFQSGIIPSDTDFRVFRDFGNTIGLDFAFVKDGYRYHTKFDGFSNIPLGSYQHVGDNALSLIRSLANAPELADPQGQPQENFVFYDFMGFFMISYSETVTIVINVAVSLLSTVIAFKGFFDFGLGLNIRSLKYLGMTVGTIMIGWIAAALFIVVTALIIDAAKSSMSWYNNPWIVFGLYCVPTVICCCGLFTILNQYYNTDNLSVSAQTQIQTHLVRLVWTVPLLMGTFFGIRSVYVILIPLLFQTLTATIIMVFSLQHSMRKWQVIYVFGTIIPTIFQMRTALATLELFVPITGRVGPEKNSELLIGVLTAVLTIFITSYYVPLITLVHKPSVVLSGLLGIFILFFIIVFTPLGFPYSGNPQSPAPQRFWIYHLSRTFRNDTNHVHKRDSGFLLYNMDRNSPDSVKNYVKDLSRAKPIGEDCKKSLFCGFPVLTSRMVPLLHKTTWIPAGQPIIHEPIGLKLHSKTNITDKIRRYSFSASGPSLLTLYISPRPGAKLIKTSLTAEVQSKPTIWNERSVYIIVYVWGKEATPLGFSLDFETPSNWNSPTFDIALTGSHKHDRTNVKTPHYKQFLGDFPNWADVTAWLGASDSWVY